MSINFNSQGIVGGLIDLYEKKKATQKLKRPAWVTQHAPMHQFCFVHCWGSDGWISTLSPSVPPWLFFINFPPFPCCPQSLWPIYRSTYLPPVSHNPSSWTLSLSPSPVCHYGKVHAFCRVESHARLQAAKLVSCSGIDICYSLKITSTSASTVCTCLGVHPICQL